MIRPARMGIVLLLAGAACRPASGPELDPDSLSLLQLDYLERADRLPAIQLADISLPQISRLGYYSPMVWRVETSLLPGREIYRPLPVEDVGYQLHASLVSTLEDFGFNVQNWSKQPPLSLRVDVEKLVLSSEDGDRDRRACSIELSFHVLENPTLLAVESFRASAKQELDGSWTIVRGGEPQWSPRDGEADPIVQAAELAIQQFLYESQPFWRDPSRWQVSDFQFTAARGGGRPPASASH